MVTVRAGQGTTRGQAVAVVVVVLVLGALLAVAMLPSVLAHFSTPRLKLVSVPFATPTPGPPGTGWTRMPGYDQTIDSGSLPTITVAPSDANVAYEVSFPLYSSCPSNCGPVHVVFQRTINGGKTWQPMTPIAPMANVTPQSLNLSLNQTAVDPFDPRVVFVSVADPEPAFCQTVGEQPPSSQSPSSCSATFRSGDGGHTWSVLSLPQTNELETPIVQEGSAGPIQFGAAIQGITLANGSHMLYTMAANDMHTPNGTGPAVVPVRFVASADGGLTWSLLDAPLVARGLFVTDAMADPASGVLYAAATALQGQNAPQGLSFWRSQDGGTTWKQTLAPPAIGAMSIGDTAHGSMLYDAVGGSSGTTIYASSDGGATWSGITLQGLPGALGAGTIAVLSGATVLAVLTNGRLYAWTPGDTAWRYYAAAGILPTVPGQVAASVLDGQRVLIAWYAAPSTTNSIFQASRLPLK